MLAVAALVDVAEQAKAGPVPAAAQLRALLGLTWLEAGGRVEDAWIWRHFWIQVTHRHVKTGHPNDEYCRSTGADSAIRGIIRSLGLPATPAFDQLVREIARAKPVVATSRPLSLIKAKSKAEQGAVEGAVVAAFFARRRKRRR